MSAAHVSSIRRIAPAKLNLFLHITGRRDDGYHLLESIFVFTNRGDEITVSEAPDISLTIDGPFANELRDDTDNNLVLKAAKLLQAEMGIQQGAVITLRKNLPIAAGIGGGSADAAATLFALCDLWKLDICTARLHALALSLGADVPACLHTVPQQVSGIGEQLQDCKVDVPGYVLLVNPLVPVATPAVFQAYRQSGVPFDPTLTQYPVSLTDIKKMSKNSLQSAAQEISPTITEVLTALDQTSPVMACMSGSGGTCFALYEAKETRDTAAAVIRHQNPKWWVMADTIILS